MAADGLKVLTYAYKDIQMTELSELLDMEGGDEAIEFRQAIENDLVYLVTFGLEDPFRPEIADHINELQYVKKQTITKTDGTKVKPPAS